MAYHARGAAAIAATAAAAAAAASAAETAAATAAAAASDFVQRVTLSGETVPSLIRLGTVSS